jgi:hypothetical protein
MANKCFGDKFITKEKVSNSLDSLISSLTSLKESVGLVEMDNFKSLEIQFNNMKENILVTVEENFEEAFSDCERYCDCGSGRESRYHEDRDEEGCSDCMKNAENRTYEDHVA